MRKISFTMDNYEYWDIRTGEGLSDYQLHERYDEMLDSIYEDVSIAGYEYSTSRALKLVDEIAYRSGFNDWLDSELGETLTDEKPEEEE